MTNFAPNHEISLEEGISRIEGRSAQALEALGQKGFGTPSPPYQQTANGMVPYRGELPNELPELSDNQLGSLLGLLSEWNNYVQVQLAETDIHLQRVKSVLELVNAKLRIVHQRDSEGKKRSNPERDDYVGSDRRYVEALSDVIYWETLYKYIKAVATSAENAFAAVSRRITQRGQDIARDHRTGSVTGNTNTIGHGPIFRKT